MKKHALLALLLCLALCLPALASAEETAAKPMMDIVWVVDCTGSMIYEVRTVNDNLDKFAAQLTDFDVQYGLVGFGDEVIYRPEPTVKIQWNGSEWTDKISDVKKSMVIGGKGGLPQYNGGDDEETSTLAITMAANQYAWREGAIRQIILVTDIIPKVGDKVPDVVTTGDLCKSKDITVNLVDCGSALGYDEILNRTNGKKVGTDTSQMEQLAQWVNTAPVVITQPEDRYVHEGDNALFTATSINGKIIIFNWYYKLVGSDKEKAGMGGVARSTEPRDYPQHKQYSVRKNVDDGAVFYCRFTNTDTGDTRFIDTRKATLHVASAFAITQQPQPQFVDAGQTATFTVVATGDDLTYQWQKQSGENWADLFGKTAATLSIPATTLADDGSVYRCVIKDAISDKQPGGYTLTSNSAALTVVAAPAITGDPQDVITEAEKEATFTVAATGTGLKYQWQKQSGSGWADLSGETGTSLTVTAATENSGSVYRCQVTSGYGTVVVSQPATLTVQGAPAITGQPKSVTTEAGKTAVFTVQATGTGLKYQWQKQSGSGWDDLPDETGTSLSVLATTENSGSVYRCQVTSGYGTVVVSQPAALSVDGAPVITGHPQNVTTEAGKEATFTVTATGTSLTYQWQQQVNGSWVDLPGETGTSLTVTATAENSGSVYRCQVTSGYNTVVVSQPAALTVQAAPVITGQPESVIITEGEDASFTVAATGEGLKYQWQVYRSGVWMNCTDGQSPTLALSAPALKDNGLAYRCVITSSYGTTVTSDTATLTVLERIESPQTGDASRPWLWLTLLGASLLGMAMLRRRRA